MKSLVNRIVLLAASAMVPGTMAYGQTGMKAKIPFAFHTAAGTLPAGDYTLGFRGNLTTLQNGSTRHTVLVTGGVKDQWNAGTPALTFHCPRGGECALTSIRTPETSIAYPAAKNKRNEEMATVVIPLRPSDGD